MAYDRDKILNKCLEAIKKNKLVFFDEISQYVEPDRSSLYNWGFDKLDNIKQALEDNRVSYKSNMRNRWIQSDQPTLQIAAYKLMASDEEFERLTLQQINSNNNTTLSGGITLEIDNDCEPIKAV
jgi:hypothetical protein